MVSSHPKNNESNDTRLTTYWAKTEHPPLPSVPQGCMVLHIGLGSSRTQRWYLSTIGWFSYGSKTLVWVKSFLDTRHWATHSHLEFRMNSQGSQLLQGWSAKALEAQGQSQDRPRDKCQSEAQRQQLESSAPVSEGPAWTNDWHGCEISVLSVSSCSSFCWVISSFEPSRPYFLWQIGVACSSLHGVSPAVWVIGLCCSSRHPGESTSRGVYNHDKNKTHDISWHI